jgi:DNA replication protein DnaC
MTPTARTPKTTRTESPSAAASRYQLLRSHLAELKLHAAAEALPSVLDQATAEGLSLTVALERLLAVEVASTTRRLAGRLRFACLPTPATLADFDVDAAAGIDRPLIDELGTCRYLDTATNIPFIGPPGTGKTHLSVGLARTAAHAGYRTYFTTAADLAARCHRAAIEGRWATTMRFFAGPTLLVIDELGYLPLPAEAASALFQVVSQRYLKTSIVITTNRGVGAWGDTLVTPPSLPPCSTGCCTDRWSSTSTESLTAYATITPPQTPSAEPPPAPANRLPAHWPKNGRPLTE